MRMMERIPAKLERRRQRLRSFVSLALFPYSRNQPCVSAGQKQLQQTPKNTSNGKYCFLIVFIKSLLEGSEYQCQRAKRWRLSEFGRK